jgi:hypothetical protein
MKIPSDNIQAPEKLQPPNSTSLLEFEIWCFSGAWNLELGA